MARTALKLGVSHRFQKVYAGEVREAEPSGQALLPRHLAGIVPANAAGRPDAVALVGDDVELTWADVDRRTASIARTLIANGVARGDRVAVARVKGVESFEAVHGILRAGAVVVPVDPLAPPDPARRIMRDADVAAVIGDARTVGPLDPWDLVPDLRCAITTPPTDVRALDWNDVVAGTVDPSRLPEVRPDDDAYVIYTSGSTGEPKGIVHTHRSAMAYAVAAAECHGLRADDRVAGMSPLHFDMSTLELYAAPLAGATVVTMSEPLLRFPASFTERSERERVSVWYTVPFLLRQVTDRGALDRRDMGALRLVMYGGEPYPPGALAELMAILPGVEIVNVYGPAEVNECTYHVIDSPPIDGRDLPIGRPWPPAEVRVLDDAGRDVEVDEPGELWVSTTTLMRGYWRRPDLTSERTMARADGPAWYATGDIVTRDVDGTLWFSGRRDHQVKVRGVRLELEAIESVLTDAPGVAHAVAGVDGASDAAVIVAAVVPLADGSIDDAEIRRWCAARLPSVAVPARIEIRQAFPSTASGKIDRRRVRADLADRVDQGGAT